MPRACHLLVPLMLPAPGPTAQAQAVDALGDPLPPGAVARLGTGRLRPGDLHAVAVSPDGSLVATYDAHNIRLWDADDGRERLRIPFPQYQFSPYTMLAFSLDGEYLAANG